MGVGQEDVYKTTSQARPTYQRHTYYHTDLRLQLLYEVVIDAIHRLDKPLGLRLAVDLGKLQPKWRAHETGR